MGILGFVTGVMGSSLVLSALITGASAIQAKCELAKEEKGE